MTSPQTQNQAAWLKAGGQPVEVSEAPMPTPEGDEVIIEVRAVAFNPADWIMQAKGVLIQPEAFPFVLGFDVAGVIASVGPKNTRFKKGDRVLAGCSAFTTQKARFGAYQKYTVGTEPLITKLPDNVSFKEAAVVPIALCTAAYALFMKNTLALDFPSSTVKPNEKGKILLVWGGASSVGACGIQAARAAGYRIAATSSAKNFGLLEELGVEFKFDYKSEGIVDQIVSALKAKEELAGVFNAIITEETIRQCADIASQLEGSKHIGTVLAPAMPIPENLPAGIEVSTTDCCDIVNSQVGRRIFVDWLEGALADGSMLCKPNPEVVGHGLEAIQDGLEAMGKGVSAKKLVVEL